MYTQNNNSGDDAKHSKDWQKLTERNQGGEKESQPKKVDVEKNPQPKM
jgi:hypothetical protein